MFFQHDSQRKSNRKRYCQSIHERLGGRLSKNKQTPKNRKQFTSSPVLISWVDELMKGSRMELIKKKELHLHRLSLIKLLLSQARVSKINLKTKTWSEPSANTWTCEIEKFGARGHQALLDCSQPYYLLNWTLWRHEWQRYEVFERQYFFSIAHRLKLRMALFWWTIQKTSLQRRPWNTSWIWFVLNDYFLNILFELRDDKEVFFFFFLVGQSKGYWKCSG